MKLLEPRWRCIMSWDVGWQNFFIRRQWRWNWMRKVFPILVKRNSILIIKDRKCRRHTWRIS